MKSRRLIWTSSAFVGSWLVFTSAAIPEVLLDVERMSQADSLWAADDYADGEYTIKQKGCALTSLAMALKFNGVDLGPGDLNQLLQKQDGGYAGRAIVWGTAIRAVAKDKNKPDLKFNSAVGGQDLDLADIIRTFRQPVIVSVNDGSHFVLVTGIRDDGKFTINDPGHANKTTLDQYGSYKTRGWVSDPVDLAELNVAVTSPANGVRLRVIDPSGEYWGVSPGDAFPKTDFAFKVYFVDKPANDETGLPDDEPAQVINFSNIADFLPVQEGNYRIEVYTSENQPIPFSLSIHGFASDGSNLLSQDISGLAVPNETSTFTYLFNPYSVPEPSTLTLLAASVVGLLAWTWRRNRKVA